MTPWVRQGILGIILIFNGILPAGCGSGGGGPQGNPEDSPAISSSPSPNPLFSAPKLISNVSGDSEGPLLGFDATGAVSVAWLQKGPASGGVGEHKELYQTTVSSLGSILYTPKSPWSDHAFSNPRMVVGEANAYYAWLGPATGSTLEVFFSGSSSTRPPQLPLSPIEATPLPAWNLDLGLDQTGQVYVAWSEGSEGHRKIHARRSSDQGGSFFTSPAVSDPTFDSDEPHIAAEGAGIANVVWVEHPGSSERHIGFARTENSASSFSAPISLSPGGVDAQCPQVGAEGSGRLYVAWTGTDLDGKTRIHLSTSTDHFTFSEVILPMGQNQTGCPRLAVRKGGGAYLVWEEAGEIYFTRFLPGKKGWIDPVNVSRSSGSQSTSPQIALDNLAVNVVWEEEVGGTRQAYFAGSKNGGTTFSDPISLSQSSEEAISPAVQSDGKGHVYVAWAQGPPGAKVIYLQMGSGARGLPIPFESGTAPTRDVNQDGVDDFIVGAPEDEAGKVHLFLGGILNTTPDFTLKGFMPYDRFGGAVGLGDINGDGAADILVGAPAADNGAGSVYIYFGPTPDPTHPDVVIAGIENSRLGTSLSSVGDIDGDGIEDLLIGAPQATGPVSYGGEAYLFLGGDSLRA
ncbi:MAG: FG-GAP repeat protein, partial [Nitrospirae bacterium]|nr:FG-GAP repeat protein [Nitrospirota bacterium]